ncbi:hypothetical protein GCM10010967_18270 [Dyadobacter beijingensis]|uniref:DUF1800 domain-containing protein n=1 Tax=Dyadobacter beijingensis TaxID=365489 RepID=A0ABQ2HPH8_9BACT|nr:DUF1800 family protein [Dyadobacter beijingensis]GGM86362.1 hypothetical protein GCM10010967_18270 [Dyadobacter beijingensis]
MAYLDTYTTPLTASTAAHLLRRATFGPTQQEIADFTGKTASQAVDILIANASYRATPPPPVELDGTRSDVGQPFIEKPFVNALSYTYFSYVKNWWVGLMAEQNGYPSVLEKLAAFWQNHFVVIHSAVEDYRFMYRYLRLLRTHALGNFRDMAIAITKDPAMLTFQNGNENAKEHPNENYARELQEIFVVGQKDFNGNYNYTEQDVKTAAQVLTGWQTKNRRLEGSTTIDAVFNPDRHDTSDKTFSAKYSNTVITGRSGSTAGDAEVADLINMLVRHPESPKYICRRLYRYYVNPNVTQEIEDNVIVPLATFFSSASNNFSIAPVIKKLLTSQIFFDSRNAAAIIKSPAEFLIGTVRLFDMPIPNMTAEPAAFGRMASHLADNMKLLQLNLLDQPTVFGSPAYYQTGFSKNWINETLIGIRGRRTDTLVSSVIEIKPGQYIAIDILGRLRAIQPDFANPATTPAITTEQVLAEFTKNLFPLELSQEQKDFLIDKILMMNSAARTTWLREWDAYRAAPNDTTKQSTILWRCRALLRYLMRMAEYQLF